MTAGMLLLIYTGYEAMTCATKKLNNHFHSNLITFTERNCHHPRLYLTLTHVYLHCADRENLRLTQQEFESLPAPLLSLLAAAVAISLLAGLNSSGDLKPISLADAPQ